MNQDQYTLAALPESFYRVSVKVLIFNERQELLIFANKQKKWEIPGGGWEYGESLESCVKRELHEEARATTTQISGILFSYANKHENGYTKLCLVVRASINDDALVPTDDDLIDAKYVSKEEFMRTDFQYNELAAQDYADTIWSEDVLKPSAHR